jgi:flagellar hook-length control protein FliK
MTIKRKGTRRLPRALQQTIDEQKRDAKKIEAIPPLAHKPAIINQPPEIIRSPEITTPDQSTSSTALVAVSRSPDQLLSKMGTQVLLGRQMEGACEFWIDLKREYLGGVQIRLSLQKGRIQASIIVNSPESEKLIRSRLIDLKRQLNKRGLTVDTIDVILNSEEE